MPSGLLSCGSGYRWRPSGNNHSAAPSDISRSHPAAIRQQSFGHVHTAALMRALIRQCSFARSSGSVHPATAMWRRSCISNRQRLSIAVIPRSIRLAVPSDISGRRPEAPIQKHPSRSTHPATFVRQQSSNGAQPVAPIQSPLLATFIRPRSSGHVHVASSIQQRPCRAKRCRDMPRGSVCPVLVLLLLSPFRFSSCWRSRRLA